MRRDVLLLGVLGSVWGCSHQPTAPLSDSQVTVSAGKLTVSSPDIREGGSIPDEFSAYGANKEPTIRWTKGPTGTKSYVLLLEDPDAPKPHPFVHWLVTNIPAESTSFPGPGTLGQNENGESKYFGPQPPKGPAHRYYFQVYALDIPSVTAADRDALTDALSRHLLAKGVLLALYQKKSG